MNGRTRARLLWLLAAVGVGHAIVNVIIFYATGAFGPVWFAATLATYGALLVATVALALVDPGVDDAAAAATPDTELRLVSREVVYRTRTGQAIRATYAGRDATEPVRYFLLTKGEALPLGDVERHLDDLPAAPVTSALADDVDAAIRAREAPVTPRLAVSPAERTESPFSVV